MKAPTTIYCDMDGVLCDFVKQWKHYYDITPDQHRATLGRIHMVDQMAASTVEFWSEMDWMPGAKKLWAAINSGPHKVKVLSAPAKGSDASPIGKKLWIDNNICGAEYVFCTAAQKQRYATPTSILIDDYKKNIQQWESRGGIGILYRSTNQALQALDRINLQTM